MIASAIARAIARAMECERGYGRVEMSETGRVAVHPFADVDMIDDEGVDLVQGLEVKVR